MTNYFKFGLIWAGAVAFGAVYLAWQSAKTELETTREALAAANSNLNSINEQYAAGLAALNDMKNEVKREKVYIREVKERVVRDNNATCLDSVNDIYGRLRESERAAKSER